MEQNARLSHLIGWRVRSEQSHKSQRDQECALALGWGSSKSFWSRKGYHCKRSSLGLPRLFQNLWDLHQCFEQTARSSNYSGEQANCILMLETLHYAAQIQCHQNWTTCHWGNLKIVQRDAMGPIHKVYTDHANLIRDALGTTLDHVYWWRLLLEEYGPEIVYIKGIHNTIADTISWLEYNPSINQTAENYHMTKVKKRSSKHSQRQSSMTVSKHWCNLKIDTNKHKD